MGVELHITRADFWADNSDAPITSDEWLEYVAGDRELERDLRNGQFFVHWRGLSKHSEPWLDWFQGNVSTKWPDTALYRKMLSIAAALGARVQDDDGKFYPEEADWQWEPSDSE